MPGPDDNTTSCCAPAPTPSFCAPAKPFFAGTPRIANFSGGPVGLDTLSASLSEDTSTVMEVLEPFLLQQGFLERTPRGRVATRLAYEYLGWPWAGGDGADAGQGQLFG